ncbi:hypothetical protein A2U01_0003854 [Trifolium medium]|uniref:Uncharacterized protein n=1 Tax=Trifolium medium TaxID=97028 RepID=A0A392M6H9_9FABA|nr:hypothetical protein [Trifolium medium]
MADCSSRFFDNRHGQFVKNGGATAFYGGAIWRIFAFPPSITPQSRKIVITHICPMMTSVVNCKPWEIAVCSNSTTQSAIMLL